MFTAVLTKFHVRLTMPKAMLMDSKVLQYGKTTKPAACVWHAAAQVSYIGCSKRCFCIGGIIYKHRQIEPAVMSTEEMLIDSPGMPVMLPAQGGPAAYPQAILMESRQC